MNKADFYLHPSSFLDENTSVGKGTKIWHFCHISEGAQLGENCVIGQNVFIGKNVKIGNGVKIQNNVSLFEGLDIADDVFIGPSVVFTNVLTPRAFINRKASFLKTRIEKGASIGANCTIVCGNNIGAYALIGAGSVLTKSVNEYELWYGNPAEMKGKVDVEGEVVKDLGKDKMEG